MNVFDLVAKITLDTSEYEKETKSLGDKLKTGFGNVAGIAAKAGVAAVGAASTAVVAVGKQALDAYSNYEQLVGGVETLFKNSSGIVQKYAANAYKTSGLSANQYMETVTSFSASLLQSLGGDTEKAAEYAEKAVVDMADNANKMGSDISSIQTAYQGFAKQNYTMLDNLKLGYGGTKSEMERLILDAEKLDSSFQASRDSNGALTMSYADIVDAIHIVQDEMDISGTTAKEASSTIQGSIDSAKAAYQNWVTGLADENADIEDLTNKLFDAIEVAANNIIPVVEHVLVSLGETLKTQLPQLVARGISFVVQHLPDILALGIQLIGAVIDGLGQGFSQLLGLMGGWLHDYIVQPFLDLLSNAANWGRDMIDNFIGGIWGKAQDLWGTVQGIGQGIRNFIGFSEPKEGPLSDFHTYAPDMMKLFAQGIKDNEDMLYDTVADAFDFGGLTVSASQENTQQGGSTSSGAGLPIIIQCVLDGKVIGEASYKYQREAARAFG